MLRDRGWGYEGRRQPIKQSFINSPKLMFLGRLSL